MEVKIIFKLITSNNNLHFFMNKDYDVKFNWLNENENYLICLKKIFLILMKKGVNINLLRNIDYIHNGSKLNKNELDKIIDISVNNTFNLYTKNEQYITELCEKIFPKIYKILNSTNTNLNENIEELPKYEVSEENIQKNNNIHFEEYLNDDDFKHLLNIYLNKPTILNNLYNYVNNGNIIEDTCIQNYNIIEESPELKLLQDYNTNCSLEFTDQYLYNVLKHFNKQTNLALRYLVYDKLKSKE